MFGFGNLLDVISKMTKWTRNAVDYTNWSTVSLVWQGGGRILQQVLWTKYKRVQHQKIRLNMNLYLCNFRFRNKIRNIISIMDQVQESTTPEDAIKSVFL